MATEKYYKKILSLESKYFKAPITKHWSIEALADEAEATEGFDYDDSDISLDDIDTSEGFRGDMEGDAPLADDLDGEFDANEDEFDGDNIDVDLKVPEESDVINLVEMSSSLMNTYYKNMDVIYRKYKFIDLTGNIKENDLYEKFIQPALAIIKVYSKETELEKKLDEFMNLIEDRKKMVSICGTKNSPFIYEMLQLLLIETLRQLLAVMPMAIKGSMSIEETIEKYGYSHISKMLEGMMDILGIKNVLGNKIYYKDPGDVKELSVLTDNPTNEAIKGTIYDNSAFESMYELNKFLTTYSASESIMNIIEIRNNKSILEFSLVMKLAIWITSIMKEIGTEGNYVNSTKTVLDEIKDLLTEDGAQVVDEIDNKIADLRSSVILPVLNISSNASFELDQDMSYIKKQDETI